MVYSDAIKRDPRNAVLYANRAAASLSLKEYLDAAFDAEKAAYLDPSYAKAWGRLGKASHVGSLLVDEVYSSMGEGPCLLTSQ